MTTREELLGVINNINDIYIAWRKNDDRALWKQNRRRDWYKQVSPEFFPAVTDLINIAATDEYEPREYELVMACDVFIDYWLDWIKELNSDRRDVRLDGSDSIWNSWGQVMELVKPRVFVGLPPIEQLIADKVSITQICRMYGFLFEDGRPDIDAMKKAKVEGMPEGWRLPLEIDYEKKMGDLWVKRLESFEDGSRNWSIERQEPIAPGEDGIDRSKWVVPEPSPESLEQLLRLPHITNNQISRMTGLSMQEVAEAALDMGIALSGSVASDLLEVDDPAINEKFTKNRERLQREIDLKKNAEAKKVDNYKELGDDVITRVFAMTDDGVGAGAILRSLQDEFPATTYEQILGWQNRRKSLMEEVVEKSVEEAKSVEKKRPARKKSKAKSKAK